MATVTQPDIWATLWPVIVGGIIGLAGGLLGPPIAHWLSRGAARRDRKADRLEDILEAIREHDAWLEEHRLLRMFGEGQRPAGTPPLARALAICDLYFPELRGDLDKLDKASKSYSLWQAKAQEHRSKGELGRVLEGFSEEYGAYHRVHLATVNAITGSTVVKRLGL